MEDSVFGEMMTRNKRIQLVVRCMEWFISCSPGVVVGVPGRSRMVAAPTTLRFTRSWTHHDGVYTHSRIPITFRVNLIMHAGLSIVPALIVTWLHTNCLIILTDANVITACLHYAMEPVTIATAWSKILLPSLHKDVEDTCYKFTSNMRLVDKVSVGDCGLRNWNSVLLWAAFYCTQCAV